MSITEVNIIPVKPQSGLIAFASVVVNNDLYLGSIAVYTKLDGSYRLLYPTKGSEYRPLSVFHPINREASQKIEQVIFEKCDELFKESDNNDRHDTTSNHV